MALPSPWPMIHAERKALAADLAALTDEQWATPSMCTDWTAGTGPEVAGPARAITLAVAGRAAAVDELTGDGVATLRSRM